MKLLKRFKFTAFQVLLMSHVTNSFNFPTIQRQVQKQKSDIKDKNDNIFLQTASSSSLMDREISNPDVDISVIQSRTLKQLYPRLVEWKRKYGNPNIPLGTYDGDQCHLLRKMHIQQKLNPAEVELLEILGFQFKITLEDLYFDADFSDMFLRLEQYQKQHPNGPTIPKNDNHDPELAAWVAGLRCLGPDRVPLEDVLLLNSIDFQWTSAS